MAVGGQLIAAEEKEKYIHSPVYYNGTATSVMQGIKGMFLQNINLRGVDGFE
jgi:hypothetical protein